MHFETGGNHPRIASVFGAVASDANALTNSSNDFGTWWIDQEQRQV